jgi:hypothetical protein
VEGGTNGQLQSYPEHSQERDMGIAATVTFFIPRWRPAPWGTIHDISQGRQFGHIAVRERRSISNGPLGRGDSGRLVHYDRGDRTGREDEMPIPLELSNTLGNHFGLVLAVGSLISVGRYRVQANPFGEAEIGYV